MINFSPHLNIPSLPISFWKDYSFRFVSRIELCDEASRTIFVSEVKVFFVRSIEEVLFPKHCEDYIRARRDHTCSVFEYPLFCESDIAKLFKSIIAFPEALEGILFTYFSALEGANMYTKFFWR
jgi:hypothetical protein